MEDSLATETEQTNTLCLGSVSSLSLVQYQAFSQEEDLRCDHPWKFPRFWRIVSSLNCNFLTVKSSCLRIKPSTSCSKCHRKMLVSEQGCMPLDEFLIDTYLCWCSYGLCSFHFFLHSRERSLGAYRCVSGQNVCESNQRQVRRLHHFSTRSFQEAWVLMQLSQHVSLDFDAYRAGWGLKYQCLSQKLWNVCLSTR